MKKLLSLACALGMLASVSVVSAADVATAPTQSTKKVSGIASPTYKSSVATAKTEVPEGAKIFGFETNGNIDTLNFRDNDSYIEYTASVDNISNKLLSLVIHGSNIPGSTTIKYDADGIKEAIKKAYPDATNIEVVSKKDGNNTYYDAAFDIAKGHVTATMNPFTAAFGERKITYK
ncbi:MAG: hypothetical protein Q4D21_05845 [Phascolarctobacterium sp.]|nr:hypothetical protein [Phascolarctobacterium sp.]